MQKVVGVLALQGDFAEHISLLRSNGAKAIEVRTKGDLGDCSSLIIPGGESTAIARLLGTSGLGPEIKRRVSKGMPFYGTCAGAILAAKKVVGEKRYMSLGLLNIDVERNAYGRQADSFEAEVDVKGVGKMNGVFIRSPVITRVGVGVEVLGTLHRKPVLVKRENVLAGTFHPETQGEFFAHRMLLDMIK